MIEGFAKLDPDKGQALRQAMSIGEVLIQLQLGTKQQEDLRKAMINVLAMDSSAGSKEFAALSGEAMSELWPGAQVIVRHWIAQKEKGCRLTARERGNLAASVSQKLGKRVFGDRGVLLE